MGEFQDCRALVVDDDDSLRCAIQVALQGEFGELQCCPDLQSARALLERWTPDVLLLDVSLPDGSAFDLLELLRTRVPTPAVVAMSGVASSLDTFRLAQLGVRGFLSKPFGMLQMREAVTEALSEEVDLRPHLRNTVGRRSVQQVQREVRDVMVEEALARAGGSRRKAARLLQISRQLLQYMLRRVEGD